MKKIAILTSFRRMPESYSLVNDIIDQIKLLKKYGHEVTFFAQKSCEGGGIECTKACILPHFKLEKNIVNEEAKKQLIEIFNRELSKFDVVITHDLMYLQSYITYRMAIMECKADVKWIHWAHSANRDDLKLKMPKAKYVYMNHTDLNRWARSIGIELDDARVVFNDKDPQLFFSWHDITKQIGEKVDLINPDIMQTYPMCSTRMDSKGIDHVIRTFAALKRLNNKVLLVICNSNGRKRVKEIQGKIDFAKSQGLDEIFFTSTLSEETEGQVPRQVVRDLMLISNVFIFPSLSEVCSNVVLEASMCKQLLVLNKSFPSLFDFGDEGRTCLGHNFGSLVQSDFKFRNLTEYDYLARTIQQQLLVNKPLMQQRKILQMTNIDTIYREQFEPLLIENF